MRITNLRADVADVARQIARRKIKRPARGKHLNFCNADLIEKMFQRFKAKRGSGRIERRQARVEHGDTRLSYPGMHGAFLLILRRCEARTQRGHAREWCQTDVGAERHKGLANA